MNWRVLLWWREGPEAKLEAVQRLEAVIADDDRVDRLAQRAAKIIRENNLAPDIMKALGVRRI